PVALTPVALTTKALVHRAVQVTVGNVYLPLAEPTGRGAGVHAEDNRSVATATGSGQAGSGDAARPHSGPGGGRRKAGPFMVMGPEPPAGDTTTIIAEERPAAPEAK